MDDGADYDCQSCGACCRPSPAGDDSAHVALTRVEAGVMSGLGLEVVRDALGGRALACHAHGPAGRATCVALEGEVGVACACGVYADRPGACRRLTAGDGDCVDARGMAGLPG